MKKEAKTYPSSSTDRIPTKSARSGLFSVLNYHNHGLKRKPLILMPAYIGWSPQEGSGLMDPVIEAGFTPIFYPIDDNLQPNFDELNNLVLSNKKCVVLVVHYFGYQVMLPDYLRKSAVLSDVTVIEDWAHDLSHINFYETTCPSDFAIFSLHKWTASTSGGFVAGNYQVLQNLEIEAMPEIDVDIYMRTNLRTISETRWANYFRIDPLLKGLRKLSPFNYDWSQFTCPLNFPMLARTTEDRHELYKLLVEHDLNPTSLYHILVPQLREVEHAKSIDISSRIINLPLHQDCTETELQIMVELILDWDLKS